MYRVRTLQFYQNPSGALQRRELYPTAHFTRVNIKVLNVQVKCRIYEVIQIPEEKRKRVTEGQIAQ